MDNKTQFVRAGTGARPYANKNGFSLLELVVVVLIITLLAGVLVPTIRPLLKDAKAAKILHLFETMASAAGRYYAETGEITVNKIDYWEDPGIDGWNGSYVDRPLGNENPFEGGTLSLDNVLVLGGGNIFCMPLPSDIPIDALVLILDKVPLETAQDRIDAFIDEGLPLAWNSCGKVYYDAPTETLYLIPFFVPQ